jgi:hypothetical protein
MIGNKILRSHKYYNLKSPRSLIVTVATRNYDLLLLFKEGESISSLELEIAPPSRYWRIGAWVATFVAVGARGPDAVAF